MRKTPPPFFPQETYCPTKGANTDAGRLQLTSIITGSTQILKGTDRKIADVTGGPGKFSFTEGAASADKWLQRSEDA